MGVFGKVCESAHVTGEEILECFSVLAKQRMSEAAVNIGAHLLKACEKLILDPSH